MRRVRGKLCRNKKGHFSRCHGGARGRGRHCRNGVSKTTGRCLKHPRR